MDLCYADPGFEVDLYFATDLRTMTAIWMGYASIGTEMSQGRVMLSGDDQLCATVGQWLGLSPFAGGARAGAA